MGTAVLESPVTKTKRKVKPEEKVELLPRFNIVYFNDNKTPFDFVIDTLVIFLRHTDESAHAKAMEIHNTGKGITFTDSLEVCELKYNQVKEFCEQYDVKTLKFEIQRGAK
jgi:ATP-dependent Clp protease adapter protein ClpS